MRQILARGRDIVAIIAGGLIAARLIQNDIAALHAIHFLYCVVIVSAALTVLSAAGVYRSWRARSLTRLYVRVLAAWCLTQAGGVALLLAIDHVDAISSRWLVAWTVLTAAMLLAGRALTFGVMRRWRCLGLDPTRVAMVGCGPRFNEVIRKADVSQRSDYAIADVVTLNAGDGASADNAAAEHKLASLMPDVEAGRIDEIWITLPLSAQTLAMRSMETLRCAPVRVRYLPDVAACGLRDTGWPWPGVSARRPIADDVLDKELFDRLFSIGALLALAPLLIAIAVAIKLTSRGPVFFRQPRKGMNGRHFSIYKFRSMYVHDASPGVVRQATRNDARITPLGRFLRRTSLDELPQFINVLRGEMSVVGPRPHAVEHDAYYAPQIRDYIQRYRVKPGITGWAQVNGFRGETDQLEKMASRIEHDLYYLNNWSFSLDMHIVLRTIQHGFVHKHAH